MESPSVSRRRALTTIAITPLVFAVGGCATRDLRLAPYQARRILFLGDSITYAGTWVGHVETWFRMRHPQSRAEFINLGLPSETVSGLSEPGHAGGSFPRPNLHERLTRALDRVKPDLVVACYGMNDGIYHPDSPLRTRAFHEGMRRLHREVERRGIPIVHLTPPVFDSVPLAGKTLPAGRDTYPAPYEGYDEVLHGYSTWLVGRRSEGWVVGDIHGPMREFIAGRRRTEPKFTLAGDGVHPGATGHWLMARELLRLWQADPSLLAADSVAPLIDRHPHGREIADRVSRRQNMLRDAWLSAVGHVRPGIGPGKPLDEIAEPAQAELNQILKLASPTIH